MGQSNWTTCSKVIKAEVNTLQTELQRLLEQNLLGIYLHGSLALGGFYPTRGDIDVMGSRHSGDEINPWRHRQCLSGIGLASSNSFAMSCCSGVQMARAS